MKRLLAALAASLLLFAACGEESAEEANIAALGTSTPRPDGAKSESEDKDSKDSDDSDSKDDSGSDDGDEPVSTSSGSGSSGSGGSKKTSAPQPKPASGTSNEPKAGTYTFETKGEATDPFNPTAPPEKYEGESTAEISRDGAITTRSDSSDRQAGRVTTRTKRETSRVLMLSFKAETPAGDFSCEFDPPLVVTKFPVKPEKYGRQDFKGKGNACDGYVEIEVLRKEAAKDANGKSWDTWAVFIKQYFQTDQLKSTSEQTRWISPDLGIEVKTDGKSSGQFGAQKFEATGQSFLRDYP